MASPLCLLEKNFLLYYTEIPQSDMIDSPRISTMDNVWIKI